MLHSDIHDCFTIKTRVKPEQTKDSCPLTLKIVYGLEESLFCESDQSLDCQRSEIFQGQMVLWLIQGILRAGRA